jgi:hypothetical protein
MSVPGLAPDQAREGRVTKALADPGYFAEAFFRPYDPNWQEAAPVFVHEMLHFMATTHRGVVVLPPEYMKTTSIQVYALWRTLRSVALGQMFRGLLCSEEAGMAEGNLSVIQWHVENNERIAHDFKASDGKPLLRKDPEQDVWRNDAIIVARHGVSRDPTWQAKGLEAKGVQGRRLDCMLGDDMVTPKNAESPALRKRALDLFDLQFETRLVGERPGSFPAAGQAIVSGNFNDSRDLVSTLSRRPGFETFRRPSIGRPDDPSLAPREAEMEHGVPLWPQVWPMERLDKERLSKPLRFRRIHLLDSRAEQGEALQTDWMQVIDHPQTPFRYARYYMGLDPAPGGDSMEDLDFFNITVGAMHLGHLDVVESFCVRATIPRQVDLIKQKHDYYQRLGQGLLAIGGAKIALDRYMRGAIVVKYPELEPLLKEISVPGEKESRLVALGPHAQGGWLRCQEGAWTGYTSDYRDRFQELSLLDEWKEFPFGRHDDRLDGLDVMIRTAKMFALAGDREVALSVAE